LIAYGIGGAITLTGCFATAFSSNYALAQITPDATLGAERSVVTPFDAAGFPVDRIDGGAIRGANLFHSFQEFNVNANRGAYFFSPANIQNILARVTGNNPSQILGTLGTFGNSQPNLFLINPKGIIFGANASLDVGGSFVATTANAIRLGNTGLFSASQPQTSNLLAINPSAFFYNQLSNQGQIVNRSTATTTVLGAPTIGLQVPDGRSLLLVGGDVRSEGGRLFALGGRIEIGGVAQTGTVELSANGNELRLGFPTDVPRADVSLTNESEVNVRAGGGGSIAVNARNVDVLGGSKVRAGIASGLGSPQSKAGDIDVNATGTMTVAGELSFLANVVQPEGVGKAGDINITIGSLFVKEGGYLIASTQGRGDAGNVTILARDIVSFDGLDPSGGSSAALSTVREGAVGNGGDINITTGSLFVTNGAQLITGTTGQGKSGSVRIRATDTVRFDGGGAFSNVDAGAVGDGGNIEITTGSLSVTNGAQLLANTYGKGNAGSVKIRATDTVSFDGTTSNGFTSAAFSNVQAGAVGNGGDIEITTGSLSVTNGARLIASTFGKGNAGSVRITATDTVRFDGSLSAAFSSVKDGAVGDGGNIMINTGSLSVTNGAVLFASTFGQGNAGSVRIRATDTVSFDGGGGASSSVGIGGVGNGGDIEIITGSLSVTNGARLSASTDGQGKAGNVRISATDTVRFKGGNAFSSVGVGAVGDGSDIVINTGSLSVSNGAFLISSTDGQGKAGSVKITATDTVSFNEGVAITNVGTGGVGNGGDIEITTGSLSVTKGAGLAGLLASTSGKGNAGNVRIRATDTVHLDGGSAFSSVGAGAVGNGGDIEITTGSLSVSNSAFLTAQTDGQGKAGNVRITATDTVRFDRGSAALSTVDAGAVGDGGDIEINTGSLLVTNGAILGASTNGQGKAGNVRITATDTVRFDRGSALSAVLPGGVGNGGDIVINTGSLSVTNGAQLIAATFGQGNAGNIKITASDHVSFAGVGSNGQSSGAFSTVEAGALGDGGDIKITTGSLSLTDAYISSLSLGTGRAGDINLQTRQNLQMNRSSILASTQAGDGGNIRLQVGDILLMRNGSNISTTAGQAGAGGNGGNIDINADFIVAVPKENSDITANAFNGRGGNINITTQGLFGIKPRPRLTPLSDITASSELGIAGNINVNQLNVDPSRGLAELPNDVVDAARQIDRRCTPASSTQERSRFIITGRGGLPPSPNEPLQAESVVTNWVTLDSKGENNTPPATTTSKNSVPRQLAEAQGWVINDNGKVVLTASAPQVTPQGEWLPQPECNPPQTTRTPES
jgi:filamentous hemagglutinin family protein